MPSAISLTNRKGNFPSSLSLTRPSMYSETSLNGRSSTKPTNPGLLLLIYFRPLLAQVRFRSLVSALASCLFATHELAPLHQVMCRLWLRPHATTRVFIVAVKLAVVLATWLRHPRHPQKISCLKTQLHKTNRTTINGNTERVSNQTSKTFTITRVNIPTSDRRPCACR